MSDNLKGALWIMLSAAFATVMSVGIKDLGPGVHSMQITFMRCIVGFIIVVPLVWGRQLREARRSGAPLRFELSKRWPLHLLRGVLATIAINCGYYSITQIPLATVTVLFFTAPFFVTLLAVPLLGEKVGWRRWCTTTFGFIGALVTLAMLVNAVFKVSGATKTTWRGTSYRGRRLEEEPSALPAHSDADVRAS